MTPFQNKTNKTKENHNAKNQNQNQNQKPKPEIHIVLYTVSIWAHPKPSVNNS